MLYWQTTLVRPKPTSYYTLILFFLLLSSHNHKICLTVDWEHDGLSVKLAITPIDCALVSRDGQRVASKRCMYLTRADCCLTCSPYKRAPHSAPVPCSGMYAKQRPFVGRAKLRFPPSPLATRMYGCKQCRTMGIYSSRHASLRFICCHHPCGLTARYVTGALLSPSFSSIPPHPPSAFLRTRAL